jgi:Restriction endonuclease AspBHI N-terminal
MKSFYVTRVISHSDCPSADLIVDAVYEGGQTKDAGSDAISMAMPGSGNQGGFRAAGTGDDKKFVVLYSNGEDRDWPDLLDLNTGQFAYFGDNKTPGHELRETQRGGNRILRRVFRPPTRRRDQGREPSGAGEDGPVRPRIDVQPPQRRAVFIRTSAKPTSCSCSPWARGVERT